MRSRDKGVEAEEGEERESWYSYLAQLDRYNLDRSSWTPSIPS